MPTPNKNETEKEFVERCMSYEDMQKYDPQQRAAICYGLWRGKDKQEMKDAFPWIKEEDICPKNL